MKKRGWIVVILPLVFSLGGMLAWQILAHPPELRIRVDLGTLVGFLGSIISLFMLVYVLAGRKEADRRLHELRQANQHQKEMHRRFLQRLDHELKNPLTALRAALANLDDVFAREQALPALQDAHKQTERLARLVFDLRSLSDFEERKIELSPFNLEELLTEAVEAVTEHPLGDGKTINLVVSNVPWRLPQLRGDRDLLELALLNLLDNAIKYTCPGDIIEVRASEEAGWVRIEVADTGAGIAEVDLPRLCEELYRGENARGVDGSGLGLALVERVIERHGGKIEIRSRTNQEHGTVVCLRLPIHQRYVSNQ